VSALAVIGTIVVGFLGLIGVGVTAWAGLRANALRLSAEERQRAAEQDAAEERAARERHEVQVASLRVERDRVLEYHEGLHATYRAEITRLELAREQENAEVRRLRGVLADENAEVRRLRTLLTAREGPSS
jgi:hypothetical protein